MKVALASSSKLSLPTISALQDAGHELVGLITKPDAQQGRGRTVSPNELVDSLTHLRIYKPRSDDEVILALKELSPECVITIAYGRLIKEPALRYPKFGWLNLHFSLLPRYRGAAPVQWTIRNGEGKSGVTVFRLDKGMDTGPIFRQAAFELTETVTSGELLEQLSQIGATAICESLRDIENGLEPKAQIGEASLAPKIGKSDARIDWKLPAREIDRLVRAMNPTPMAWCQLGPVKFRIGRTSVGSEEGVAGRILNKTPLIVATGSGSVEIREIQPEGKRMMPAGDWIRGSRVQVGDCFE